MKKEKFLKLFIEYKNGNTDLEETLVEENINLVYYVIAHYFPDVTSEELKSEMFSEGLIGLLNAIRNFDITYNNSFSTFAIVVIKNQIARFLNNENKNIDNFSLDSDINFGKMQCGNEHHVTYKDIICDDFNMEKLILGDDYVSKMINSLPSEYKKIAYLYFVLDIKEDKLAKYFNVELKTIKDKIHKMVLLLRENYKEMDLTKEEIICHRFMKLSDNNKRYLLTYLNTHSYAESARICNLSPKGISARIIKSINSIGYSEQEINDALKSKNISFDNCLDINNSNSETDYTIINKFVDLKEKQRKILVARLSKNKAFLEELLQLYEINNMTGSTIYLRAIKSIGFTESDIINCFKRHDIFSIYTNTGLKELNTFELLNLIYSKLPNEINEERYNNILNKFDSLTELDQKIIIGRLYGYTNKELKEFINQDISGLDDKSRRRVLSLGNSNEVRLCLSRKFR